MKLKPKWKEKLQCKVHKEHYPQRASEVWKFWKIHCQFLVDFWIKKGQIFTTSWNWQWHWLSSSRIFFSKMRSRDDMPTVLEFVHLFAPMIRESLKLLTNTGFLYYTSPSTMQLAFHTLPSVRCPSTVQMTKEDQQLMRDRRNTYGKPVRQLTVRNQSTKDNVGTLPIFAYTTPFKFLYLDQPASKDMLFWR